MSRAVLASAAVELGVALDEHGVKRVEDYLELLAKWNRVYNLTAIRNSSKWISHHILDSLAVVAFMPAGAVIDVGSGAGLPGIPIAIACPQRRVTLLDSSHKKTAFLRQCCSELRLDSTSVVTARTETYRPESRFGVVISRAYAELADFVRGAAHLCDAGGRMLAMKGVFPHEELSQLPPGWVERVVPLKVPLLDAERHLVIINPAASGA